MKVVINKCWGGYGLSHKAMLRYFELKKMKVYCRHDGRFWYYYKVPYKEFEKVEAQDEALGNYKESNALCLDYDDIARNDPVLVQVVEELGDSAGGEYSELKIVEIPDGVEFVIDEYDGMESVEEKHRSWG